MNTIPHTNLHEAAENLINRFFKAYTERDLETLKTFLPHDGNITAVGVNWDQCYYDVNSLIGGMKDEFKSSLGLDVGFMMTDCHHAGDSLWVSGWARGCILLPEGSLDFDARCSFVLQREMDGWVFRQYHLSIPSEDRNVRHSRACV